MHGVKYKQKNRMGLTDFIILIAGSALTVMLGIISFLIKERFDSLKQVISGSDDKMDKLYGEIISVKSRMLDVSASTQRLEDKVKPTIEYSQDIKRIQSEVIMIKDYQIKKLEPVLTHIEKMSKEHDLHSKIIDTHGKVILHLNEAMKNK